VVQTGQGLDKHIATLIPVLVSTGSEEVQCVFKIEIVVSVKVASNEIVNLFFRLGVKVLELVHSGKLDNIQTVWQHTIWLSLEQMLRFERSDMRDSCEHICRMRSSSLDTISVIDSTLSSFGINIKVLQVVVEINAAGAKVTSQESCMGGENGGDVNAALATQWETDTS
jgi:hypothetical protein